MPGPDKKMNGFDDDCHTREALKKPLITPHCRLTLIGDLIKTVIPEESSHSNCLEQLTVAQRVTLAFD